MHGWVDARIHDWMAAHDIAAEEYEWKGTWTGAMDMDGMHRHLAASGEPAPELVVHVSDSEQLLKLAAQERLEASPRDGQLS